MPASTKERSLKVAETSVLAVLATSLSIADRDSHIYKQSQINQWFSRVVEDHSSVATTAFDPVVARVQRGVG
jgi:hypothetical protein